MTTTVADTLGYFYGYSGRLSVTLGDSWRLLATLASTLTVTLGYSPLFSAILTNLNLPKF